MKRDLNTFTVIIEKAGDNYSGFVPDLPGCIATGKTRMETENNMVEAISFHIQGLIEDEPELRNGESCSPIIEFQYSDCSG
jgi:predicted RNase H-like HicB family nuclease